MLWPFILVCLSEIVGEVEKFIEENTDLTLKAETDALVAMMRQETPDRRLSKHCYRRIHEALRRPNDQYGVRSLLRRISGACETLEGREELESSEYLDVDRPGWFWSWHALLVLIDVIKDVKPHLLDHAPLVEETCALCLETLTEKGHMSSWMQLEPCRHWICSECGLNYIKSGARKCLLCRAQFSQTAGGVVA